MEGLPRQPGAIGFSVLLAGLVVGMIYGAYCFRRFGRTEPRAVAWIVSGVVAVALGSAPFISWRIVEDIRFTSSLDSWIVPRYGVSVFRVHPEIFDNAARLIPAGDPYYLAPSPQLDDDVRAAFREWALGYLLPRVAVADPYQARWILTLGVRPASVGPPIEQTWVVKGPVSGLPAAYLGKAASQ